jgi:prepilin-type N-terminal cleavage/methylation domain-containing protein
MANCLHHTPNARKGFTMVELMVVVVIISILSSLTLAGLAVAQRNSKADKTRSTIRKLHELIVPHYESFLRRRVPLPNENLAAQRLSRIRTLTLVCMPDSKLDMATAGTGISGTFVSGAAIPDFAWNGVARSYGAIRTALPATSPDRFPSSECLYIIVSRGLQEPGALEQFRADEIGDSDGDGAPEFHDGWRQPIMYVRWPVGYSSVIQSQNAALQPDPFDPSRVSTQVNYPTGNLQRDYAVVPLICSAGADGDYGISTGTSAWSSAASLATIRIDTGTSAPGTASFPDASDNITNHDLNTR